MEKVIAIKENKLTFYVLLLGILASFGTYVYSVNATVWNGVSHQKTESYLADMQNKVSDLEYKYAEKRNSVSIDTAKSLGLVELKDKVFISKNSGKALSFNNVQR